jgi:orotate phosphoribosyltransferase
MHHDQDGWMNRYHQDRAFWVHDGDAARPHVVIPGGLHSSGYFNSDRVAETPFFLDFAAADLVELAQRTGLDPASIDRVVGPAESAATIAHDIARNIVEKTGFGPRYGRGKPLCKFAYAEKAPDGSRFFPRAELGGGESVIVCEDVLLTGRNADATARAAAAGTEVLPFFLALVNRTGRTEIHGRRIVALIHHDLPVWEPGDCPLCKKGSLAIDPRPHENWHRLNAGYRSLADAIGK